MRLICFLIVMSCMVFGSEAAKAGQSDSDLDALLSKVTVVTCIEPPYQIQQKDRPLTGVSIELVQMMLKEAGLDLKIKVYPWARAYSMAQRLENVMLFSILRNPPREKYPSSFSRLSLPDEGSTRHRCQYAGRSQEI